jgi:biopolymer transport protein ExbD
VKAVQRNGPFPALSAVIATMRLSTLIATDELPDGIQESIKNGADAKIYIRADTRAKYGDVKHGLGEIRKTGIQNVCFFAERVSP